MRRCVALFLLSALCVVAFVSTASADHVPPLELSVFINGGAVGVYDEDALGCSASGTDTFSCAGTNLQLGGQYGMNLDSWDLSLDSDPVVTGITAVTNLSGSNQQFTLIFTLPTTVAPSSRWAAASRAASRTTPATARRSRRLRAARSTRR